MNMAKFLLAAATIATIIILFTAVALQTNSANKLSIYDVGVEVNAVSGSAADIQAAVNQVVAQGGRGTVHVPAGTFNFYSSGETWEAVPVPAGINIYGAANNRDSNGQNTEWRTVLVMPYLLSGSWSGGMKNWFTVTGNGYPNKPTRICDLKLVGYRSIDPTVTGLNDIHKGIAISNVVNFRVDHMYFDNIPASAVSTYGYKCNGVIDHCYLMNGDWTHHASNWLYSEIGYGVEMHRAFSGYSEAEMFEPTADVLGHYKDYSIYIENCVFHRWRHGTSSNDGTHYVVRHCTFEAMPGEGDVDAHGVYGNYGTRASEFYHNQWLVDIPDPGQPWRIVAAIRGGALIWFDNYISPESNYQYLMFMNEAGNDEGVWRTNNCYIWDQPAGSKVLSISRPAGVVTENVHYFVSWSSSSPPASWNIVWYAPYVYPHPLTVGAPLPTPAPTPDETPPPEQSPTPAPSAPPVIPSPPEPTGNWFIDAWDSFWYWLRWEVFGFWR